MEPSNVGRRPTTRLHMRARCHTFLPSRASLPHLRAAPGRRRHAGKWNTAHPNLASRASITHHLDLPERVPISAWGERKKDVANDPAATAKQPTACASSETVKHAVAPEERMVAASELVRSSKAHRPTNSKSRPASFPAKQRRIVPRPSFRISSERAEKGAQMRALRARDLAESIGGIREPYCDPVRPLRTRLCPA